MGALDLNRVAISMGKVLKSLSNIEPYIKDGNDVYEHKEDLCSLAYFCRVGILDRIEKNSYMANSFLPIRIPTGILSSRKETMASALNLTVGKIKQLASLNDEVNAYVNEILDKGNLFYEFDRTIPDHVKRKI